MGVLYIVRPLDDEMAVWLKECRVAVPESNIPARNPTPGEVRRACQDLPDFNVTFEGAAGSFWQAAIDGAKDPENEPWTLLNVTRFSGNEDDPHEIWFEKGWPSLILDVVRRLARWAGPLVVVPDTGESPVVVTGNDSVSDLMCRWDHTSDAEK